jgi:hypothetical protein
VLVAIILVAVVILGGIAVVAMGFGGELALSSHDELSYPYFQTAKDVAAYRPPAALLGYDARATEHALRLAGEAIADRDAEIAALVARLDDLAADAGEVHDDDVVAQPAADDHVAPVAVSPHGPAGLRPTRLPPISPEAASRWESRLAAEQTGQSAPVTLHREEE